MSIAAIITARGGSRRIPRKNIKPFCGKPIICYSIQAALKSKIFDEVMVSTDSEEIAEIARGHGACVPFMRSERTSNDFAGTEDVLLEVVDCYAKEGKEFQNLCCIYPTAPFVTAEKLRDAYRRFEESDAEGLFSVAAFSYPPQRGLVRKGEFLSYLHPEHANARSQDLETVYHDAGQFYFVRCAALMEQRTVIPKRAMPYVLGEMEVQDIDNPSDWSLAELKYRLLQEKGSICK